MSKRVPLTCSQADAVYAALRPLPADVRDEFLQALASAIDGRSDIGDGELWRLVKDLQRQFWTPPPPERSWANAHTRRRVGEPLL
jgi:hypothetical protein